MQPTHEAKSSKKLRSIHRSVDRHWVSNGFPVRTLFASPNLGAVLSSFLLLDYAGPMEFSPTAERRGVGEHPHRGFETMTIVYAGEVEHRDSSGVGGRIGPGDVQLSLSRLNHGQPGVQAYPEVVQGTAEFHHVITNPLLQQSLENLRRNHYAPRRRRSLCVP